jgi:deoxyhypusine synthase
MTATAEGVVLVKSVDMPEGSLEVKGYDFNQGVDYDKIFESMMTNGFQATNFAMAVEQIQKMRKWRLR